MFAGVYYAPEYGVGAHEAQILVGTPTWSTKYDNEAKF